MSSRQNRQPQWPMSSGYYQQNPFPYPYDNPSTGAQYSGRELPSATLNLTRKGRIDGPLGGTTNAYNNPQYQQPAYNGFPITRPYNPSQSNIDSPQYQPHRAQPQPNNIYSNNYAPSTAWHNSGQTVHAGHPPAAEVNNHSQGTSRTQGVRREGSSFLDADDEFTDDNASLIRGFDHRIPEQLHPEYQVRRDQRRYFVPGRVFKMLYITTRGSDAPLREPDGSLFDCGPYGHAKIQRFVVIMAKPERQYSSCVTISTNGGTGTMKKKLDPAKQVIAYTSDSPPQRLQGERFLNKDPVKIEPDNQREKLDPASRIDLEKLHNVEHNVSVCHVGNVKQSHLRMLLKYCSNQMDEDSSKLTQSMESMGRRRGKNA